MKNYLFDFGDLDEDGAYPVLSPYLEDISECMYAGHRSLMKCRELLPKQFSCLKPRTLANMMNDLIVNLISDKFSAKDNVYCLEKDFLLLDFDGQLLMRFKKLNKSLKPENVKTGQQRRIAQQCFLGRQQIVTAGYRINAGFSSIKDMFVVYLRDNNIDWTIPLPEVNEDRREIIEVEATKNAELAVKAKFAKNTLKENNAS